MRRFKHPTAAEKLAAGEAYMVGVVTDDPEAVDRAVAGPGGDHLMPALVELLRQAAGLLAERDGIADADAVRLLAERARRASADD